MPSRLPKSASRCTAMQACISKAHHGIPIGHNTQDPNDDTYAPATLVKNSNGKRRQLHSFPNTIMWNERVYSLVGSISHKQCGSLKHRDLPC